MKQSPQDKKSTPRHRVSRTADGVYPVLEIPHGEALTLASATDPSDSWLTSDSTVGRGEWR